MKYIQSGGGYYYKQYKNGKKVRISKRAYNKKIKSGGTSSKFNIGERVQCHSDICFQNFDKHLTLSSDGEYITFKHLNLEIEDIYYYNEGGNNNEFDIRKREWAEIAQMEQSNNWIIYKVKSLENNKHTINYIEEKSLYKFIEEEITPLSEKVFDSIENKNIENQFVIHAHGSECIQEKDKPLIAKQNLMNMIKKEIFKPVADLYKKCIEEIITIKHPNININNNDMKMLSNIIECQIAFIFGSPLVFKKNRKNYSQNVNMNLPELNTIKSLKEENTESKEENIESKEDYYYSLCTKGGNYRDLNIYTLFNTPRKYFYLFNQYKYYCLYNEWDNNINFKKMFNDFYPIFITNIERNEDLIQNSPVHGKNRRGMNKIEYLNLDYIVEKIRKNECFNVKFFKLYFEKFLKYVKNKNLTKNYEKVFEIYKTSLNKFDQILIKLQDMPSENMLNYDHQLIKNKKKIDKLWEKFSFHMEKFITKLKTMINPRKFYIKLLRDIVLYDNQYVIMKCDAACSLYTFSEHEALALVDKKSTGVRELMNKWIKFTNNNKTLKEFCIYKNMVPNIMLSCAENLKFREQPLTNYNNYGVFKLPLQFKKNEKRTIIPNPDKLNEWEVNVKGIKKEGKDGVFPFLTNIKYTKDMSNSHKAQTSLEKIIKKIRDSYGEKTPFVIISINCRSGICTNIEYMKRWREINGGLKNKKKVKAKKIIGSLKKRKRKN